MPPLRDHSPNHVHQALSPVPNPLLTTSRLDSQLREPEHKGHPTEQSG